MKFFRAAFPAALISGCFTTSFAFADTNTTTRAETDLAAKHSDVKVTLGLGLFNVARYLGSDERRYRAMPMLHAVWSNGWFASAHSFGYNFSKQPFIGYGLRMSADFGRKESASTALTGLGDVGARAEAGGFFDFSPSKSVRLSTGVRYGSGPDRKGALLDLGANYRIPLTDDQNIALGVSATYANSYYMQSFYGVTTAQSAASGYAVYSPSAGIRDMNLNARHTYKIDSRWNIVTGVTFGKLGSNIKAAPITRSSSHNSAMVAVNYTF